MDFNKTVIEKSFDKPVLVDFWAPWCGPCRVLGPTLEQLAAEQADRWELVKVNTEEEYELSEQFRIRSIPNVKLFHRGEMVAEFMGALPRTAIESWLDEHLPDDRKAELEQLLDRVQRAQDGQALEALEAFAAKHPDMKEAVVATARELLFSRPEKAIELVADIHMGDKFHDQAEDVRQLARLQSYEPDDSPAGQALGEARQALRQRDFESAIQKLIQATIVDKSYADDLPRKTAIALFRTLGEQHELTKNYRRKFDMALY